MVFINRKRTEEMTIYTVEKVLNPNLIVLMSIYGSQMWNKVTLRKNTTCEQIGIPLPKGTRAYRPHTNGYNRMDRISEPAMETLVNLKNHE